MKQLTTKAFIGVLTLLFWGGLNREIKAQEIEPVFDKGRPAPEQFFTGNAYVTGLISNDSVFTTAGGEVFFEAGARSNWHSHPAGQILIVTAGIGYHQIKGQPIEVIHKGDVVKCPPDVDHWHGASKDASMSHIYIVPNTEKGIVEWKEPVTGKEYNKVVTEKK
ncbi:cupin domain-containing protein [Maribellus comscasis]|uniref:Cupin domain-containing protein n=1 Tax=Maribellus comscasis TaxID=2681766 RepID=A0A6I6JNS4_9BACT|nr:cupin domain-containing protein [Maribellus comscasis]QGY42718.1 cupin domain-containing protein [Maribellus comscasis]